MTHEFLFVATMVGQCLNQLQAFMNLCKDLGIPLATGKTTNPPQVTFLGVTLHSVLCTARLPRERLVEYRKEIHLILGQLESLISKLNFAASVVPACPFLCRLIDNLNTVKKPYHFIRCTKELCKDLNTWDKFLKNYTESHTSGYWV